MVLKRREGPHVSFRRYEVGSLSRGTTYISVSSSLIYSISLFILMAFSYALWARRDERARMSRSGDMRPALTAGALLTSQWVLHWFISFLYLSWWLLATLYGPKETRGFGHFIWAITLCPIRESNSEVQFGIPIRKSNSEFRFGIPIQVIIMCPIERARMLGSTWISVSSFYFLWFLMWSEWYKWSEQYFKLFFRWLCRHVHQS